MKNKFRLLYVVVALVLVLTLSSTSFVVSADEIEAATGYDFFELLPDNVENVLEARAS